MSTGGRAASFLRLVTLTALVAGCGGGSDGGNGGAAVPPSVSGTIRASSNAVVDGDTNDPTRAKVPNDTFAQAQAIPSAVTVGGYAHELTDVNDVYLVDLAAGQTITLDISDWNGPASVDLDLCLFAFGDTTTPIECLIDSIASESLTVLAAGRYYVAVEAFLSGSNYLLRIGQPVSTAPEPATSRPSSLALSAEFVPGEVLVRFKPSGLRSAAAESVGARAASVGLAAKAGAAGSVMLLSLETDAQRATAFRALAIDRRGGLASGDDGPRDPALAAKLDTVRVMKALRRRADVASADPNFIRRAYRVPRDPLYKYQWHYPLIRLPQAWDITNPGTDTPPLVDVVVAVVDSGVLLTHPDLATKLLPGFDFVSNAAESNDGDGLDADPDDPGDSLTPGGSTWHGTHVAGTVAARSDDGAGVAGVAWGARILPVRALGRGGTGTSFDILQGIRWAAGLPNSSGTIPPRRADIINLSLGGPGSSASEAAEFAAVREAGVIVIAAAGNENTSVLSFPASYEGVTSVSAVDLALQRAPYSNTGPSVDVAAPGGDSAADLDGNAVPDGVVSTWVDTSSGSRLPSAGQLQGTSMAAPHVAGVAALMKSVCATLTPAQFESLLATGALTTDIGTAGRDDLFGHGLIDALAAVQAAESSCGLAPAPFITVNPTRIDLGPTDASAPLRVTASGEGEIGVSSVSADEPWLRVSQANVDANGIGTYVITVNRVGLANGRLGARITVTPTSGSPIIVPVTLQVGFASGVGDAGRLYVLLMDPQLNVVAQTVTDAANGAYAYSFPNVTPGTYFVAAGSDADNDGEVCDAGEACGQYPTLGSPREVIVTETRGGIDFPVSFRSELTTTIGTSPPVTKPLRRVAPPKTLGAP